MSRNRENQHKISIPDWMWDVAIRLDSYKRKTPGPFLKELLAEVISDLLKGSTLINQTTHQAQPRTPPRPKGRTQPPRPPASESYWEVIQRKADSTYDGYDSWAISLTKVENCSEAVRKGQGCWLRFMDHDGKDRYFIPYDVAARYFEPMFDDPDGRLYYRIRPGQLLDHGVTEIYNNITEVQ